MTLELERPKLTDEQREVFLAAVAEKVGTREALRRAGITGGSTALTVTRGEARRILNADEDLKYDYDIARGRDIEKVKTRAYEIALDEEHKDGPRLVMYLLDRAHPDFRQNTKIEVTGAGGQPIQLEDRSASLADVARVLEAVGALAELSGGTPRRALPAAADVLAEPL